MVIDREIQPPIVTIDKLIEINPIFANLDNGVPFYQIDAGTQELVKLEFIFKAGAFYQSKKLLASITNKLMAQGTKSFSAYQIADKIDSHGAYLETNVDKDKATIALYCLNKHLNELLPLLREIIYEPFFSEKEFLVLLNKSKQEYFINLEKVKYLAAVNFTRLIYGESHPYGLITEEQDFDNLELSDIKQFYSENYRNDNCKIIVSGIVPKDFISTLNKYFDRDDKIIKLEKIPNLSQTYTPGKHKIKKAGSLQSAIRIGKPLFNRLHSDYKKFSVLNAVLGGYFGSRLMSNIREEKGYTYGISSSIQSLQHSGFFSIITEVGAKSRDAAIEEIYKEIELIRTEEISEKELKLVKNYIIGQIIRGLDGPFDLAEKLKILIQYNLHNTYYQDYVEEILTTTSNDLIQIANQYLSEDSLIELVVGS